MPTAIPERLALLSVATPLVFVVAVPALLPLSRKVIVFPLITAFVEAFFSVAESEAVPPNVPEADATVRVVFGRLFAATVWFPEPLFRCFTSPPYEALTVLLPVVVTVNVDVHVAEEPVDAASVQDVGLNELPPVEAVRLTVPVGVLAFPAAVSVTVAVQVLVFPGAVMPTGLGEQLSAVLVERLLTLNAELVAPVNGALEAASV